MSERTLTARSVDSRLAGPLGLQLAVLLGLLVAAPFYAQRLTHGVDLWDESLYAIMTVELTHSDRPDSNLVFLRLAGFLSEPFVRAFQAVEPTMDGLILFLRWIYAGFCLATGMLVWRKLRPWVPEATALLCGLLPLVFIPFGLPSPSYNTCGLLALLAGLVLLADGLARWEGEVLPRWSLLCSAALAACAGLAYPSMIAALAAAVIGALWVFRGTPAFRGVVWWSLCLAACLFVVVGYVTLRLGTSYWGMAWEFHAAMGCHLDAQKKLAMSWELFTNQARSPLCFLIGLLAGVVCARTSSLRIALGAELVVCAVAVSLVLAPVPIIYSAGHDVATFLAVVHFPLLFDLVRRRALSAIQKGLLGAIAVGWVAGLVTTWTATNALFNFAIGGCVAAVAGLAYRATTLPRAGTWRLIAAQPILPCAVVLLAICSVKSVYGVYEQSGDPVVRIDHGPFAGLQTSVTLADKLAGMEQQLARHDLTCYRTVYVHGWPSGAYLLTSLAPCAPVCIPVDNDGEKLAAFMNHYYAKAINRPDLIIEYRDEQPAHLSRAAEALMAQQYQAFEKSSPFTLYRRADLPAAALRGPLPSRH